MKRYFAVAVLMFAIVGRSWAGFQQGSQTVNLNLGTGIPLSTLDLSAVGGGSDKIGTAGLAVGGEYLYYLTPLFALGLDGNYSKFGDKNSSKFSPLVDSTVSAKSMVVLAVGKYTIVPEGKILPYLLGGFGLHNSSLKFSASPAAGLVWADTGTRESRVFGDDSASSYALAFGLGVDVPVNERVFIGIETRYQYLGSVTYSANSLGRAVGVTGVEGATSMVNVFARAGYKF